MMDFAICPSYCPRPTIPLDFPSTVISVSVKQATQLRFSHSSLSLLSSSGSTRRPLGHSFHQIHALDKSSSSMPSKNEKGDNKIVKATLGASLVLACALGIIGCSSKMSHKAIAGPREMSQKAPHVSELTEPFGGKLALGSLLGVSVELISLRKTEPAHWPTIEVPPGPSMEEINAIKMEAVKYMKSGMPEEAVNMLRDLHRQCEHEPEPAYNLEMALVEILIHLGRYEEASECNCLKEETHIPFPSDGRFPLYKAIIYTMLDRNEEASEYWKKFSRIVAGDFPYLPS